MITSIQHFCENGVKNLTDIFKIYTNDLTKIEEMVYGVTDEVTRLGCSMIAEEWEFYDELLRKRKDLRQGWYIVRRDETSLLTSLGEVIYHKTLFKNVATGESCYLLDQLMGLERHARITEDAEARILQEAASRLWTEVLDYLDGAYDLDAVDRIYINGDGAAWIRTGEKIIPKSKFVLDKYHMHKYIIAATSHLEDTAKDARSEIYKAIHRKKKWMADFVVIVYQYCGGTSLSDALTLKLKIFV